MTKAAAREYDTVWMVRCVNLMGAVEIHGPYQSLDGAKKYVEDNAEILNESLYFQCSEVTPAGELVPTKPEPKAPVES